MFFSKNKCFFLVKNNSKSFEKKKPGWGKKDRGKQTLTIQQFFFFQFLRVALTKKLL